MRFMIRFAHGRNLAIGFHSIPTVRGKPLQSESQLGTYQSHGCVRQSVPDAFFLWLWAPVGTPVVVI
jgi:lipoprotein-anchoring transpeptidase ErfK/SrfK